MTPAAFKQSLIAELRAAGRSAPARKTASPISLDAINKAEFRCVTALTNPRLTPAERKELLVARDNLKAARHNFLRAHPEELRKSAANVTRFAAPNHMNPNDHVTLLDGRRAVIGADRTISVAASPGHPAGGAPSNMGLIASHLKSLGFRKLDSEETASKVRIEPLLHGNGAIERRALTDAQGAALFETRRAFMPAWAGALR